MCTKRKHLMMEYENVNLEILLCIQTITNRYYTGIDFYDGEDKNFKLIGIKIPSISIFCLIKPA